jgi:hypothetical protein
MGGKFVGVGAKVGSVVGAGVLVLVGVNVTVGVTVGSAMLPVPFRITKINAAPRPKTSTTRPSAAGRLNFNSGSLGDCTGLVAAVFVEVVKFLPQTRQRVAFSLKRVPQVGQTLLGEVLDSGLIYYSFKRVKREIITSLKTTGFLCKGMSV